MFLWPACRSQDVVACFVSGYHKGDPNHEKPCLHAWAEVYLPGGGWRGYDPPLGLTVALAAPVSASFCGTGGAEGTKR